MSDPYRPAYYPPPGEQRYDSHDYSSIDQYGPLIPQHQTSNASYNPPQSSEYMDQDEPPRHRRRHSRSRSRSRSRSHRSKSLRRSISRGFRRSLSRGAKDRSERSHRSKSRTKEFGATAAGGVAGAWLGHELGHSTLGTVGGLVVGAIGARELEKRHERHKLERDAYRVEKDGVHAGEDLLGIRDDGHRRRRSSGGLVEQFREKVGGLLEPGERRGDDRRSRSHVGSGGSNRGGGSRRYESDDSESEGDYAPSRRSRGSRRDRNDYD